VEVWIFPLSAACFHAMNTKQIVQDPLQRLPEDVSLHDVAQEIEFVSAVRQGLSELDRGERIPIDDVERELPSWVTQRICYRNG
jgi:hypothetical protein